MTDFVKDAVGKALKVDGWLSEKEATLLCRLAHNADGPIIEIGSWQGRSTTALALGAAAGRKAKVYAVDPFLGPQPGAYKTALGNDGSVVGCSPEKLRANLDAAGVNGHVHIVSETSREAAALELIPAECALLFIDGAHDYQSVLTDLELYLPRVKLGGYVVLHDVHAGDRDVVRAVEDKVLSRPNQWRVMDHVDTAMVLRRVESPRYTVNLLCPGRGYNWGPLTGIVQSTLGAHRIDLDNNGNGWDDFTTLWCRALNRYEAGGCSHVAMLHSDIAPQAGWIDLLIDEMEEHRLDFLSVACATKDQRGVCNGGIGVTTNRWGPYRRLTVRELLKLPPTFDLDDLKRLGYCGREAADKVLLHNTGCWVADLRRPVFTTTYDDTGREDGDNHYHEKGDLKAWFDFPTRIRRDEETGLWMSLRESEDWFFSRQLHKIGARTAITRKISLAHEGQWDYRNDREWGTFEDGDRDTEYVWNPEHQKGGK